QGQRPPVQLATGRRRPLETDPERQRTGLAQLDNVGGRHAVRKAADRLLLHLGQRPQGRQAREQHEQQQQQGSGLQQQAADQAQGRGRRFQQAAALQADQRGQQRGNGHQAVQGGQQPGLEQIPRGQYE